MATDAAAAAWQQGAARIELRLPLHPSPDNSSSVGTPRRPLPAAAWPPAPAAPRARRPPCSSSSTVAESMTHGNGSRFRPQQMLRHRKERFLRRTQQCAIVGVRPLALTITRRRGGGGARPTRSTAPSRRRQKNSVCGLLLPAASPPTAQHQR